MLKKFQTNGNHNSTNLTAGLPISTATKLKFFLLFVLWIMAFYPVYLDLIHTWIKDSNNSHGILVPLISLYLIWQKREQLSLSKITNSKVGGLILIMSMGLYLLAYAGGVGVISRSMIISSLVGLILFSLGKKIFMLLAFPLFFLIFMIPVPDSILDIVAFPLKLFATKISSFVIQAVGIPVFRDGNVLYFAQTELEVAEACSGIRSIMSLSMLSVLFIYFSDWGWCRKAIVLTSVIPIAVVANIIRVSGIGIIAYFYGDEFARNFIHQFSGFVVFVLGLILLFIEYALLNRVNRR